MKKIAWLLMAVFLILGIGIMSEQITFARVTSSSADRDAWCVGVSGAEVCVDSSGNFVPTTTNSVDLGTSALEFKNVYVAGTVTTDAIVNAGAYSGTTGTFTGQLTTSGAFLPTVMSSTTIASTTFTVVGQLIYNSTRFAVCVATSTTGAGSAVFQSSNPITTAGISCKE